MNIKRWVFGVNESEALFKNRGFFQGPPTTISSLESIGISFLKGYHLALETDDTDILVKGLNAYGGFNGFCFEGAGMGLKILDSVCMNRRSRFAELLAHPEGNKHEYMIHVGAGWAYARLPFKIEIMKKQHHNSLLWWLALDGYGFHQAYFKTKKYVDARAWPQELRNPYSVRAFYQGVGRCLWFIECGRPDRIAERIRSYTRVVHADLWAGVGLASTYACGVTEDALKQLIKLSADNYAHLAQGSVFAAKARQRAENITPESEMACNIICSMTIASAAEVADRCHNVISSELTSAEPYEAWRSAIRNEFCTQNSTI